MRMNSKYAGKCGDCKKKFSAGTLIDYDRNAPRGLKAFHADCENPEDGFAGNYASSAERNRGNKEYFTVTTSGGTFTQNKNGRCEDAPCCGCCNSESYNGYDEDSYYSKYDY